MLIYPAIDLYQGKAVRLFKGDYAQMTVYSENPPEIARDFKSLLLFGSIHPQLDNFGLFRPDKIRKLRQTPKLSNFNRHQKTTFDFLL